MRRKVGDRSVGPDIDAFTQTFVDKGDNSNKLSGSEDKDASSSRAGRTRTQLDVTKIICALMEKEKATPHEDEGKERRKFERLYSDLEFIDDVNHGDTLPKAEMIQARIEEMRFFRIEDVR